MVAVVSFNNLEAPPHYDYERDADFRSYSGNNNEAFLPYDQDNDPNRQ